MWPMTVHYERKLASFENKVLRTICEPVFDNAINKRKRKNAELKEIIKVLYDITIVL